MWLAQKWIKWDSYGPEVFDVGKSILQLFPASIEVRFAPLLFSIFHRLFPTALHIDTYRHITSKLGNMAKSISDLSPFGQQTAFQ